MSANATELKPGKKMRSETYSFRMTHEMKQELLQRASELGIQPSEYLTNLIDIDLTKRASELKERERTFIEQQFQLFSDKLLTFFTENVYKTLLKVDQKTSMTSLMEYQILVQSVCAAKRSKELLSHVWNDNEKLSASDKKISNKVNEIHEKIKECLKENLKAESHKSV
jgi:hypothetical protein